MKNKEIFNTKQYQQKDRVYSKIQKGISKCWLWDESIKEYRFNYFEARKKGTHKKEDKKTFQELKEAKNWLYGAVTIEVIDDSPKLMEVLTGWKQVHYSQIRKGSRIYYDNKTKILGRLLELRINKITPQVIDAWIGDLKEMPIRITRCSFDKEIDALKILLTFYKESIDEPYNVPIKQRHYDAGFIKEKIVNNSIITKAQFHIFQNELLKSEHGLIYAALATFQFYHALRISEASGVSRSDFKLSSESSENRFIIRRSLKWEREKNSVPTVEENFKNSKEVGTKSGVLHMEAADLIKQVISTQTDSNLGVFMINGKYLTYRQIQHKYNQAMKDAGLDFKSTHIMRKGGASEVYNKTGNVAMVQAVLGVSSMEIAQVYAKPEESLLHDYYKESYKKI